MTEPKFGLLGATLAHSYSPLTHSKLGDYEYNLYEKSEAELDDFFANGDWQGINVTIPYKKTVLKYCDELSSIARIIGCVNTIVRREDGTLYGDNTDAFGFELTLDSIHADVAGSKVIVLGSGGASLTAVYVLRKLRARSVTIISRTGENNYENLDRHYDADFIINATPVGMYPESDAAPIDLTPFKNLKAVVDMVYNPSRTNLVMQAEGLGIPCIGGMRMLVAQAAKSAELFIGVDTSIKKIKEIANSLMMDKMNVSIIGMPGSGKTRIGRNLSRKTGLPFYDSDEMIIQKTGRSAADIITQDGEAAFRNIETEILKEVGNKTGSIIATGGGSVTRKDNYRHIHRNGLVVWVKRDLSLLATKGRPLSEMAELSHMYTNRRPLYEYFSDVSVDNDSTIEKVVNEIIAVTGLIPIQQ